MITRGRWRGRMPFRQNKRTWPEPLEQQGRTGEPSPASYRALLALWAWFDTVRQQGDGMAEGSFTERARMALWAWMEKNGLNWYNPISFQYRLYRRRTISVTINHARIYHRRIRGDGSKGFVLEGRILSIDGAPPAYGKNGEFALTRIIGSHPIRLLAEGGTP